MKKINTELTKEEKKGIQEVYDNFMKIMVTDFLYLCQLLDNIDVSFTKGNDFTAGILADKENNISIVINYSLVSNWNSYKLLFVVLHELFHYLRGDLYDTPDYDMVDNCFSDCIINNNIVKLFRDNGYLGKNIPLTMAYENNVYPDMTYMSMRKTQNDIINDNSNIFMPVEKFFDICSDFIHYPITVKDDKNNVYTASSFQTWNLFFHERKIVFHHEKDSITICKMLYKNNKEYIRKEFFLSGLDDLKKRGIEQISILNTKENGMKGSFFKKGVDEKVVLKAYSPKKDFIEEDCEEKEFFKIDSTDEELREKFIEENKSFVENYVKIDFLKKAFVEKPFLMMPSLLRKHFPSRERYKTWKKMNRRYIHRGEFQKGYKFRKLQEIVICVDTSGSVYSKEYFSKVLYVINKSFDDYIIKLVLNDDEIRSVMSYKKEDYNNIKMIGNGGTSFNEFFNKWMPKNYPSNYKNIPVFVFTDMCFHYNRINKKLLTKNLTFIIPESDYCEIDRKEINECFNNPNLAEMKWK